MPYMNTTIAILIRLYQLKRNTICPSSLLFANIIKKHDKNTKKRSIAKIAQRGAREENIFFIKGLLERVSNKLITQFYLLNNTVQEKKLLIHVIS